MTRAGTLRHKLVFQAKIETSDGMGGQTTTWSDRLTTWGQVRPLTANEAMRWGKLEHEVTHRIFLRWQSAITPEMRIKHYSHSYGAYRYFEITSLINKDERNINLELLATEVKDA